MADGGKGSNRVVIGSWSEQAKQFVPCLIVDDTCTVTVAGDLIIQGKIDGQIAFEGEPRKLGELTPDAKTFVVTSALSGLGGGSFILPEVFNQKRIFSIPEITGETGELLRAAGMHALADADLTQFIEGLNEDPSRLAAFVTELNNNTDALDKLKAALGGA
jgi:hypothetical protein